MVHQPQKLYVVKRDGRKEEIHVDKITSRIQKLCYRLNMDFVDPVSITLKVINGLYPGVTTVELDTLAAETAAMKTVDHPDYATLAARITVSNLHKETKKQFSEVIDDLYNMFDARTQRKTPMISEYHHSIIMKNADRLNSCIIYDRDFSYTYFGLKTLERSYLLKINGKIVERPQHMLMRVAVGIHGEDIESTIQTYNLLSEKYFTHASPTLFAAATPRPQLSSCFLLMLPEDSLDGIFECLSRCAIISKSAGGIGVNMHNVRAKGTSVAGLSHSNGLVPLLRVFNNTARYVDQGGNKRPGAFAIYLEPWHADILDFLNLKKNTGKEALRARDLFYAMWIPDLFMKRVESDGVWSLMCPHRSPGLSDCWGEEFEKLYEKYETEGNFIRQLPAREVWKAIIVSQVETGTPYMLYKDACNRKSNQQNLGTIKSSNLCTEIVEYTSPDEVAVCNLASIAVNMFVRPDRKTYDFQKLREITKVVTKNLDKIIDVNYYPIEEAKASNMRHRPIGIGIQGLADAFILMCMPFDSEQASLLNKQIFETLYYAALEASCELAEKYGPYSTYEGSPVSKGILQYDMWNVTPTDLWDWSALKEKIAKHGVRNSLLLAPMPTASTAQILGNNESVEPYTSNIYTRRVLSGEFQVVNQHLINDLTDQGLWDDTMKNQILANFGSIQNVPGIPDDLKAIYKTVWEISQKVIINMAADRGAFIDQSQSLNIHVEKPSYGTLTSMHFYGWKKGLKTGMYYLRTKPAAKPIQFTVDKSKLIVSNKQNGEESAGYFTNEPKYDIIETRKALRELSGGTIVNDKLIITKVESPHWLRNDIIIERNAELIIEAGVTIKVEPQVGITVRGVLTAEGTEDERITITTAEETSAKNINFPDIRLVDGPTILAGRLQIRHNGQWRSVCTNSRNWTSFDLATTCRQLGFQGGAFQGWFNRQMPNKPRLLLEQPNCSGTENSLFDCRWDTRQLGSGVCDYHPDLAIECLPRHEKPLPFWRGIRFENALSDKFLTLDNTRFLPKSRSKLQYVNIHYAGAGRDHNTTSALDITGVPPVINHLEIFSSAYNGINVTNPEAPININNCKIRNNRGYGIFINSSYGLAHIDGCTVTENGGDGIRFVRAEERPDERADRYGYNDFCQLAIASSQTFPLQLFAEQTLFLNKEVSCNKVFTTRYGHVLTFQFIRAVTTRNDSASIEILDGSTLNHRMVTKFSIRNNTRPQAVTSTGNQIFIKFRADPSVEMAIFMRIMSGLRKSFDVNVSNSDISENVGRGIAVDNLRSQIHVYKSSVSKNEHVAGIHVTSGVGDVNVTESRISFNDGDGINVTYTGGSRNISKSSISSNKGYGVAIWLNNTAKTEYIFVNQTTVVQYSEIYKNLDIGVLHGNYCGDALFNFTENSFKNCLADALEILSCWKRTDNLTKLQIGHNRFIGNERISLKIYPAVNLHANIEYNHFRQGTFGGLLVKNKPLEEFNVLKNDIVVQQNYFINNSGTFVVNLGISPYAENQHLLFTRNFVKSNKISEPFQMEDGTVSNLNPRSRVAAPVVVGSSNIDIFRNIIENPDSKYEIGSHFEDQSKTINCTFNWLGFGDDKSIFYRIFHRYDRYNLAKIIFIPFLLHNSNPLTTRTNANQFHVPKFSTETSDKVGGEIEGEELIPKGEYVVVRDITIRPGGKLTIEPGVTLRFPPSIGMMVGGRLDARGIEPDSIRFTLKEELVHAPDNVTYDTETEKYDSETELVEMEPKVPIRLLGGSSETEGRLQLKINDQWGTVCNYGWTMKNAALVCQQLGYVLNPDDWNLERNEVPAAGTAETVILSNIQCDDFDLDITKCKSESTADFLNSCNHDNDVGVRCYKTSWAGVRFSSLAERTDIQFLTIEKAGLLDYATVSFKPAMQLDFARQNFENIRITDNYFHGLGIMYSDIFSESVNIIKNSDFSNNKGAGMILKQLGLTLYNNRIENNYIGLEHNPILSGMQQRELAGWFTKNDDENHYNPFSIPYSLDQNIVELQQGETKYLVTSKVVGDNISRSYKMRCDPGWVLGIQLLNPIENRSTESIVIHDALSSSSSNSQSYVLKRDLTVFPTTSSAHGIVLEYASGSNAFGGVVLVINTVKAPVQNVYNRIVKGPVPTLSATRTTIRNNMFGIKASFYNRYLDELGNHFLRKANESLKFLSCEISHNLHEAVFVHSPYWDLHMSNISEVTFMFNKSIIADNGKGVYQFSRDMRFSNNLFHYVFQDNTVERNKGGGIDVSLPYVWQYNENFTHSVYMDNNTWINNKNFEITIDGHFAIVNITNSAFRDNYCKTGLLAMKGMEKKLLIMNNRFINNNGRYMVEFSSNSQSEIIGNVPAVFINNELRNNRYMMRGRSGVLQVDGNPTCVVGFRGIQKVRINRNLFSDNSLSYQLLAGIKTAKINNFLNVAENWWGSNNEDEIKSRIFDFDDWNDHAIAQYRPYLLADDFQSSYSVTFSANTTLDLDDLGGRIYEDLILKNRGRPYTIHKDLTVMPNATLTIYPGVVMEFAPNVGILVLGVLNARGYVGSEIIMEPLSASENLLRNDELNKLDVREKREVEQFYGQEAIRLCKSASCVESDEGPITEGFLEYFNGTTLQWIPMCDSRFTERNAQVVCRELGLDPLSAFFDFGERIDFHSNSLSRIWTWPEPLQCTGTENKYEDCPIRLNGQQFGHRHNCEWNSKFVFIHCDRFKKRHNYWGGIRFADAEFEQQINNQRIHDIHTHQTVQSFESTLEYVKIIGAGILHNEKSSAVQSIMKSPRINYVEINNTAFNGIDLISPSKTMILLWNDIQNSLGVGINILSLSGEGRESAESSFTPLRGLNVPYNLFSLVDICDTHKEIRIEERLLVYYKYDNHPVNCIKIFRSSYNLKPLGLRLLQFDLFNSTTRYGIPDFLEMYDGDIYNVSSTVISRVTMTSGNENKLFRSTLPSLSVKLFANGASSVHGFIAEVVTLPISAIGFNRDVQHNVTRSVVNNNREGALLYMASGEVNPTVTIEKNQFKNNCRKLYGNFTTCRSAVEMDVQNTQTIFFRSNLVEQNQGGLYIKADSRGSATSLRGLIHNNLFVNNSNLPTVYIEGRKSSPYQEVTIYRNYFTRNVARFHNNIVLRQVVTNFTYNYIKRNIGFQNLEISGFDRVRLNTYQTATHNGFYHNFAEHRDSRSTVVAGTADQHYVDNIFFNPDNDYEMVTVNRSLTFQLWDTRIDAANNYWGNNVTEAVGGRIKDQRDDPRLLNVVFEPFYMNNRSILNGKCPPGWDLVGETCYMYVGAPMTFWEAKAFCQADNASIPYLLGNINYLAIFEFLRRQDEWFLFSDRVWVQQIDRINECTSFVYQSIEVADCQRRSPFICEIDPKVQIRIHPLGDDMITISVISSIALALLLIILVIACWWSKSKYRQAQRLERKNSIRQSVHSLRSLGLSQGSFADPGYRRKATQLSTRSTDTLTKKMIPNGSVDSMEKSTYGSSIDDSQSYEVYEAHHPNPSAFSFAPTIEYHKSPARPENQYSKPTFDLAFKNEGFRDNSTFATNSNYQSRAESTQDEETPIMDKELGDTSYPPSEYYTNDTLPLRSEKSDSTLELKHGFDLNKGYDPNYSRDRPNHSLMQELQKKLPQKPPTPPREYLPTYLEETPTYSPDYNTTGLGDPYGDLSGTVLETDFDEPIPHPKPKMRSKSEVFLETNFDYSPPGGSPQFNQPISDSSRSKSQPLETAM
ncbi:hypothetical protein JTB14_001625 [Gonioctena quinquepunctata]|nr:hypothetical protein JTB14_001625 [Gonioctena quinquepunctata]